MNIGKTKFKFQIDKNKSDFHNSYLEKEFAEVVKKHKVVSNRLAIVKNYIFDNEDYIEIGVYLLNLTKNNVLVKELPIEVSEKNNLIYSGVHKFEISIESNSSVFFEMFIDKKSLQKNIENYNDISIIFNNLDMVEISEYSYINIKEIIPVENYKATKDLRKYVKNLGLLKKDKLGIDVYNLDLVDEYFEVVLIFRNTYNKSVEIKSVPICISDSRDILVHKSIQTLSDFNIKCNSGKFLILKIPVCDIEITNNDFKNYKVDFQG